MLLEMPGGEGPTSGVDITRTERVRLSRIYDDLPLVPVMARTYVVGTIVR